MLNYFIFGAGAIGSAIGCALAKAGMKVSLIARPDHVEAIRSQGGIKATTLEGTRLQSIKSFETVKEGGPQEDSVVLQTIKAYDTENALHHMEAFNRQTPVICFQNGIGAEEVVSKRFKHVYGGVVRFTATCLVPGTVEYASKGKVIVGRYPEGRDALLQEVQRNFTHAGFETLISDKIQEDKWLKVLVNLVSCVKPITIKDKQESSLRKRFCRKVLSEGIDVLNRAGIAARSYNNTEDQATDMLKKFELTASLADGEGQGIPLRNSTYQSMIKKAKTVEADYYTGKIIELGDKNGVDVSYNKSVLHWLHYIATNNLGPESIPIEQLLEKAGEPLK